ncbi:histidinol phosphate aminotransferase apoenzyme [Thermosyntropha lipolytica DSM 11003]|uniref:Histidinol-phosphate aminotransferase n=1 Tax=Thermosyntropha lipolytica DSM 11003 TaxID=1123382 RepID=A0A1M5L7V7_9FIRM|nr:histidinol-phosphate transaminase [Thermosyntropha lipolytica]SHG61098.1 histidinol phosphate aminotransferase apoenzyme [Thermosyntropha lipolytica DSM 11003]
MNNFVETKARKEIFRLKPYVPGKPIEEVKRELGIEDIIKMASNENPLGPSPLAVEKIKETLDKIHFYPDSNNFYLKQKLAGHIGIGEECILIGNGSDELLKLLAEAFLTPEDEVVFGDPSFVEYEFTATIMGAKCIAVPLNDFRHDLKAMLDAVTPRTKIVYVCNPNNPTGTYSTRDEIKDFMDKIREDVLVVFDEAYYEYVDAPDYMSGIEYVKAGRNAIVLRTFSKIYGLAGLRVGYGITTPAIAQAVERVTEPFNVNLLAQVAAEAALDDKEHLEESRQLNLEGKKYLYSRFEEMGLRYVPTQANFIFVDTGRDCREVFKKLLQLGIIIRTGDIFGFPTFIRVTIGTPEENKRFIEGLKKVLGE